MHDSHPSDILIFLSHFKRALHSALPHTYMGLDFDLDFVPLPVVSKTIKYVGINLFCRHESRCFMEAGFSVNVGVFLSWMF